MKRIEWDGSLATGHDLVDDQHKVLLSIFNEYVDSVRSGRDPQTVEATLVRLSDYASTHFAEEEQLMRDVGYPDELIRAHTAEHRRLSERTRELILAYRVGEESSGMLTTLLREWLADHIGGADRELVRHIGLVG